MHQPEYEPDEQEDQNDQKARITQQVGETV
jgi:hypothetical protein